MNKISEAIKAHFASCLKIKSQNIKLKVINRWLFKVVFQGSQSLAFQNSAANCELLEKMGI